MVTEDAAADADLVAELQRLADTHIEILTLVQGRRADGVDFWAYAAIPPGNFLAFRQAQAAGGYRLTDFGRVLRHGTGTEPPEEVRREMARDYDADEGYETRLIEAMTLY